MKPNCAANGVPSCWLSPTLAKLYADVSEKTLRRDVDALLEAGVIQREADGLRVDLSNLLAFKG